MKNLIIVLLIAAGVYHFWNKFQPSEASGPGFAAQEAIKNPVYAETRVKMDFPGGRSLEGVMLGKTYNQEDCEKHLQVLENDIKRWAGKVCSDCKLQLSECKSELLPRYAQLFDNEPTNVTYISLARGDRSEREYRLIFWGVTVAESNQLCNAVPEFQKKHKGEVKCIRSVRG